VFGINNLIPGWVGEKFFEHPPKSDLFSLSAEGKRQGQPSPLPKAPKRVFATVGNSEWPSYRFREPLRANLLWGVRYLKVSKALGTRLRGYNRKIRSMVQRSAAIARDDVKGFLAEGAAEETAKTKRRLFCSILRRNGGYPQYLDALSSSVIYRGRTNIDDTGSFSNFLITCVLVLQTHLSAISATEKTPSH